MNLYAILPKYTPGSEVKFILAKDDKDAMQEGVYAAAKDIADGDYFSPSAGVYLVAENVKHVGEAWATDAPADWEWAHPAVEENALREASRGIDPDLVA